MSGTINGQEALRGWLVSTLLNLVLPLLPLAVEHVARDEVSDRSWVLAASMYAISTGVVSRYAVFFIISMLVSLFYTAMFGVLLVRENVGNLHAPLMISAIFAFNAAIKFRYHATHRQPFTDFALRSN